MWKIEDFAELQGALVSIGTIHLDRNLASAGGIIGGLASEHRYGLIVD